MKISAKIKKRIDYLESCDIFDEGEKPMTPESKKAFFEYITKFLYLMRKRGEPVIGLFNDGAISAEWRHINDQSVLITFINIDLISFSVIFSDPVTQKKSISINGAGDCAKVIAVLKKLLS